MGKLILVRHGESEWNVKNLFTGKVDVSITDTGKKQAMKLGKKLADLHIDVAFHSALKRTQQTLEALETQLKKAIAHKKEAHYLNERDYGIYTGKNKEEVRSLYGEEVFKKIRRSWDHPIPQGESLEMVFRRVTAFFHEHIDPLVKSGKTVLVVAHGNTLRALIKHLENIAHDAIADVELKTSEAVMYNYHPDKGYIKKK